MASLSTTCLAVLVLLSTLVSFVPANATSCGEALADLLPCEAYLMGFSDISVPCCDGARAVLQSVATQADRRAMCQCLKTAASSNGINTDRAKQLPQLCNIQVPVPIDPNINCDTIPLNQGFQRQQ